MKTVAIAYANFPLFRARLLARLVAPRTDGSLVVRKILYGFSVEYKLRRVAILQHGLSKLEIKFSLAAASLAAGYSPEMIDL